MSHCMTCDCEMDACEASQYFDCRDCRKQANGYGGKVRTLYRRGAEEAGRKGPRAAVVIGGTAEQPDLDDEGEQEE